MNLRAIKCPYHAWVYGLDGSLNGAPRFGDVPGFDKREYPLIAARVAEWHGWVFVNASGDAPALDEYVGNLDELVAPWEIDRMFVAASHDYVINANWKTITENYHECYHCPSIHPALCVVTPVDSGANFPHDGMWVGGSMELKDFAQTMSISGESGGVRIRGLERPAGARGLLLRPVPEPADQPAPRLRDGPPVRADLSDRDEGRVPVALPTGGTDVPGFSPDYASEFWDITNREDWLACESVTRGLASNGLPPGAVRLERGRGPHLHGDGGAGVPGRPRRPAPAGPRAGRRGCLRDCRRLGADLGSTGVLVSLRA